MVSEQCAEAGDATGAREMGERALTLSSNNETAVRRFIGLLANAGDRAAALAVYQNFAAQMAQEYGIAPSPETRALIRTWARETRWGAKRIAGELSRLGVRIHKRRSRGSSRRSARLGRVARPKFGG